MSDAGEESRAATQALLVLPRVLVLVLSAEWNLWRCCTGHACRRFFWLLVDSGLSWERSADSGTRRAVEIARKLIMTAGTRPSLVWQGVSLFHLCTPRMQPRNWPTVSFTPLAWNDLHMIETQTSYKWSLWRARVGLLERPHTAGKRSPQSSETKGQPKFLRLQNVLIRIFPLSKRNSKQSS